MVNTGRPSRGCETCRRRRVKCDLRRPGCYRCEKLDQPCSGYRYSNDHDYLFSVQTQSSYGPRGWQKPSTHRGIKTRTCLPEIESLPVMHRDIIESWELHVIPLILSQFSPLLPDGRPTHLYSSLESPFDLIRSAESGSLLNMATYAVGSAYLANKTRLPKFSSTHRVLYGRSLRVLNEVLQDPQVVREDSTLMAVWILCLYELMADTPALDKPSEGFSSWEVHSRALESFIRLRGSEQFKSKRGCQLFQMSYNNIQISNLQTSCQPPPEASAWLNSTNHSLFLGRTNFIPLFSHCDMAARICNRFQDLRQQSPIENAPGVMMDIIRTCSELEMSINDSFNALISFGSSFTAPKTIEEILTTSIGLYMRTQIDASFLRIDQNLLQLLSHLSERFVYPASHMENLRNLRSVTILQSKRRADRILQTVPYFLPASTSKSASFYCGNWANSLRLLWPLRLVASSPFLSASQNASASSHLTRIAYEVGIRQAVGGYLPAYMQQIISTDP